MARTFQIKRGEKATMPTLAQGEFGFVTDNGAEELHIGNGSQNIQIARQDYVDSVAATAGVQSDWNENNPESKAYVKNRPFYTETAWVEEVPTMTVTTTNGRTDDMSYSVFPFSAYGQGYNFLVYWGGVEHLCTTYNNGSCISLGDLASDSFQINYNVVDEYCYIETTNPDGEYTIEIYAEGEGEAVKIDSKYLPDSVKAQSDWNQNDENAPDHVKNRPFGESEGWVVMQESTSLAYGFGWDIDKSVYDGLELRVSYDGTLYEFSHEDIETIYMEDFDFSEYPFEMTIMPYAEDDENYGGMYNCSIKGNEYAPNVHVIIYNKDTVITKIDPKYLPRMVATLEYVGYDSETQTDVYALDKTFSEMLTALEAGETVIAMDGGDVYHCMYHHYDEYDGAGYIIFSLIHHNDMGDGAVYIRTIAVYYSDADGEERVTLYAGDALATIESVDEKIANIPTPDVSGQIETHNTNPEAHADIRTALHKYAKLENILQVSSGVDTLTWDGNIEGLDVYGEWYDDAHGYGNGYYRVSSAVPDLVFLNGNITFERSSGYSHTGDIVEVKENSDGFLEICAYAYGYILIIPHDVSDTCRAGTYFSRGKESGGVLGEYITSLTIDGYKGFNPTNIVPEEYLPAISDHTSNTSNPHGVTAAQVGAFPIEGGTITGKNIYLNNGTGRLMNDGQKSQIESWNTAGDDTNRRILEVRSKNAYNDIAGAIAITDRVNGVNTEYKIYGDHNKPTPGMLGAVSNNNGIAEGSLRVQDTTNGSEGLYQNNNHRTIIGARDAINNDANERMIQLTDATSADSLTGAIQLIDKVDGTMNYYNVFHEGNTELIMNHVKTGLTTESWTFTLEDGSTVTKAVYVG